MCGNVAYRAKLTLACVLAKLTLIAIQSKIPQGSVKCRANSFSWLIIDMSMSCFQTKNQKKSRATANHVAEETYGAIPHSFVFHRGQIGKNVGQLIMDVRRVMEPYTAESLKVRPWKPAVLSVDVTALLLYLKLKWFELVLALNGSTGVDTWSMWALF